MKLRLFEMVFRRNLEHTINYKLWDLIQFENFQNRSWSQITLKVFRFPTKILTRSYFTVATKWPSGTYGTPRAKSGCPSSNGFTWHTGWRYQDTEDWFPSNKRSSSFHLDAWVSKNNLKRTFCMKTTKTGDSSKPSWPKGKLRADADQVDPLPPFLSISSNFELCLLQFYSIPTVVPQLSETFKCANHHSQA